jgi:hypothetical protein
VDALWKFLQAEALDELGVPDGHLAKVLIVGKITVPGGAKRFMISSDPHKHKLHKDEEVGLLATALGEVLDGTTD